MDTVISGDILSYYAYKPLYTGSQRFSKQDPKNTGLIFEVGGASIRIFGGALPLI
jgi:hypothetical protein